MLFFIWFARFFMNFIFTVKKKTYIKAGYCAKGKNISHTTYKCCAYIDTYVYMRSCVRLKRTKIAYVYATKKIDNMMMRKSAVVIWWRSYYVRVRVDGKSCVCVRWLMTVYITVNKILYEWAHHFPRFFVFFFKFWYIRIRIHIYVGK